MNLFKIFLTICLLAILPQAANSADYQQVAGLIDTRTQFSDGAQSLEDLVQLARYRGFRVLFVTDHDRIAMEYGLYPLRNIIKKLVDKNSVNKIGANEYLAAIAQINKKYPDIVVIPGVECAPFYYWSGSPFGGNKLTAHDWERHILALGLTSAKDISSLPDIHNSYPTLANKKTLPAVAIFLIVAICGLIIYRWQGGFRIWGIILAVSGILLAINYSPLFPRRPYDQYHGPQGIGPYQTLIDDVNHKGGLTFWNHPETATGIRKMPPINVSTPSYPEVLDESTGYTGFASIYGDNIFVTKPGHKWDKILRQFCAGERQKPIWGISTADYHEERTGTGELGFYQTVFLVRGHNASLQQSEIMDALKNGRFYASRGPYRSRPILADFKVINPENGSSVISGEEINISNKAAVHIAVSSADHNPHRIKISLIRGGELIRSWQEETPAQIRYEDRALMVGKTYYRLEVKGDIGQILANPIFVKR